MLDLVRRDEHTFWDNERPITDVYEALHTLASQPSSTEPLHLSRDFKDGRWKWEIIVPWYREGSSGSDTSGMDYYQIDAELAQRLVQEAYVEPRRINYVGGFYVRETEFVITDSAKELVFQFERGLRQKAQTLLTPGLHTDLTGEPRQRSSGRDNWRCGRYFVEYATPLGETCRVYPEQDEVICPYPPAKAAAA